MNMNDGTNRTGGSGARIGSVGNALGSSLFNVINGLASLLYFFK